MNDHRALKKTNAISGSSDEAARDGLPLRDDTSGGVVDREWLTSVSQRLRHGLVVDSEFDDIYPTSIRIVSKSYWTPIMVAIRAATLLAPSPATRVVDIGSGAGKFCIVGAAVTGASFVGIEHRERLVEIARTAASRLEITGASFFHGTFDSINIETFDAVYLFNPFEENLWRCQSHLDGTVELSDERYDADIARAESLLARARVGTRVVTYHGFGGRMPACYTMTSTEYRHTGHLDLWVKTDGRREFRDAAHSIASDGCDDNIERARLLGRVARVRR